MKIEKLCHVKPEIRTLGVDDGNGAALMNKINLVGVVFRGRDWLDGVLRTKIDSDGINSTSRIAAMVNRSSHSGQIRLILLGNIFFGKSNIVDIHKLSFKTGKPVIALLSKQNMDKTKLAFNQEKAEILKGLGEPYKIKSKDRIFYIYLSGIELAQAEEVFRVTSKVEAIPESLRLARLIASALNNSSHNLSHV